MSKTTSQAEKVTDSLPIYRQGREYPYRLRQSINVYQEERQYLEGFTILNNVLAAGTSYNSSDGKNLAAYTPSTQQLVLAATIVVHPLLTTRAKTPEDLQASNEALRFLRNVNYVVGPINADFATVFTFKRAPTAASRRKAVKSPSQSNSTDTEENEDEEEEHDKLRSPFAQAKSVFAQVIDFWQVVGWAFNCSIAWKKRWERWKLWLAFVLDVLEDDWDERFKRASELNTDVPLAQSIILRFLQAGKGRSGRRRIMRAIFADGQEKSLAEFSEVWRDETKVRKITVEDTTTRKKVNLDEDEWGDYDFDPDDDEVADYGESTLEDETEDDNVNAEYGGIDAMKLRQRLLTLLPKVATNLREQFTSLEELLDVYTEFMRPLSLSTFNFFISNLTLPTDGCCALLTNTLLPFLAAPPTKLNIFTTTQEELMSDFFPYSANTASVSENAKMSLLVSTLLMRLWECGRLDPQNGDLRKAVENGVQARKKRAMGDARTKDKGKNPIEERARNQLANTSESILLTLDLLEMDFDLPSRSLNSEDIESGSQLSSLGELNSCADWNSEDVNGEKET